MGTRIEVCRVCGTNESKHVAMLPGPGGEEPHQYAVCPTCYADQRARFYTKRIEAAGGTVTPEQAAAI